MPALPESGGFRQIAWEFSNVKFAPPSVDIQIPNGGKPGARLTAPPLITELTPRTPRVDPTNIVVPSITMDEMERPSKAGPEYAGAVYWLPSLQVTISAGTLVLAARCVQVLPPSVDL